MAEWERYHRKHSDEKKPAKAVQGQLHFSFNDKIFLVKSGIFFYGSHSFFLFLYRDQCSSVLTQRSHQSSSSSAQTSNHSKTMKCLCYQGKELLPNQIFINCINGYCFKQNQKRKNDRKIASFTLLNEEILGMKK